jgi:hypothetical protein
MTHAQAPGCPHAVLAPDVPAERLAGPPPGRAERYEPPPDVPAERLAGPPPGRTERYEPPPAWAERLAGPPPGRTDGVRSGAAAMPLPAIDNAPYVGGDA